MSTIEFPGRGRKEEETDAELELQPQGEAVDLEVDAGEPAVPASSAAPAERAPRRGTATVGVALLLIASLAAVGVLWKQRGELRTQVTGLESALADAQTREAATQATVGDVAAQLGAIQGALAGLLSAQPSAQQNSQTAPGAQVDAASTGAELAPDAGEAAQGAAASPDDAAGAGEAEPGGEGWVDRALTQ